MKTIRGMRAAMAAMLNDNGGGGPWGGRGGGSGGSGGGGDGGGGNGKGPRNPWSQPPEGDRPRGGKGASALDELLRRAKTGGGNFGGGDNPNLGKWIGYGLAGVVVLWFLLTSFHQIEPAERGVVTRLGRYSHTLEPGVSFTLPAPIDRVQTIDVQNIRTIDIPGGGGEKLVLTRDQNLIDLEYTVRWTIRDPELYFFQSVDPEGTIRNVAESTMRAALANMTLNEAIGSGRTGLEGDVSARMQQIIDAYRLGVRVQGIAIRQTDPPAAVVDAFKEVSAAQQKAQTSINQSRAYAQQILQKAEGDAGAFDRVYAQYKLSPEVTRRRMYYETMERVLAKVDKTVVEGSSGVTPYLPLPALRRAPAPEAPAAGAR